MIRLGSLAGYSFDGPRVLGGFVPPATPAVFVILYRADPQGRPDRYAVTYVGHSDDLSAERLPFRHPSAGCWVKRAGSKWRLHIATFEAPGATRAHREQIARELIACYKPRCNNEKLVNSWKPEWIGS